MEILDLVDVWSRELMVETCCEGLLEAVSGDAVSAGSSGSLARLLREYEIPCRRIAEGYGNRLIDAGLLIKDITLGEAKAFVDEDHANHKSSLGWRWGTGCSMEKILLVWR